VAWIRSSKEFRRDFPVSAGYCPSGRLARFNERPWAMASNFCPEFGHPRGGPK
jgi:hypothetical protein